MSAREEIQDAEPRIERERRHRFGALGRLVAVLVSGGARLADRALAGAPHEKWQGNYEDSHSAATRRCGGTEGARRAIDRTLVGRLTDAHDSAGRADLGLLHLQPAISEGVSAGAEAKGSAPRILGILDGLRLSRLACLSVLRTPDFTDAGVEPVRASRERNGDHQHAYGHSQAYYQAPVLVGSHG